MIGEVLIFVPSIGQYYGELLDNHIESAELAILPFTVPGGNELPDATCAAQILSAPGRRRCCSTLPDQRALFRPGRAADDASTSRSI